MHKVSHNRCMRKDWAAEARLRTLTTIYKVVTERVRSVQVACIQVVVLYGHELRGIPMKQGGKMTSNLY